MINSSTLTAPTGESFPIYRRFSLLRFNPFGSVAVWRYISRDGLNMYGRIVSGFTRETLTKIYINPKNAPPRIKNIFSAIYLWSFIWKEGRTLLSKETNRKSRYSRFYKHLSLRIIIKGAINYVRRKGAYSKGPPMGYGHYENKRLVCSILGNGIRGWSFDTSTLY